MSSEVAVDLPAAALLERAFERDLAWLSRELGADVKSATPVSPLRGLGHPRTAFHVRLSDGRHVKLRRMSEVEEAAELERLLAALSPLGFPRVLARKARSLVIEWIQGEPFSAEPETPDRIADAAGLLGRLHRTPSGDLLPAERKATAELARAEVQLDQLVGARRLTRREADSLAEAMRRRLPERCLQGIVHGDFAPENFVMDPSGVLRVVDNETVRIGVLDLDLARVWSRWPMTDEAWRDFLAAYRSTSARSCRDEDLVGWKLRTLIVTAWYRTAFELNGADPALSRLREFGDSLS